MLFNIKNIQIGLLVFPLVLFFNSVSAADVYSNCITTAEKIINGRAVGEVNTIGIANPGTAICPGSEPCTIVSNYQVNYELSTGLGVSSGEMKLVGPFIPTVPSEVILASYPLNGKIDLSLAFTQGLHYGSFDGKINLSNGKVINIHVDVLIPFPCSSPTGYCYVRNGGSPFPAVQSDLATGVPGKATLRFETSFSE